MTGPSAKSLTRALGLEGYDVVQATDGNTALSLIESTQPDVAILDVMMPNIDGLTVCRVLRAENNRAADPDVDGPHRDPRPCRRPRRRRRRLPRQAVRARRAAGPVARPAAADDVATSDGDGRRCCSSPTCASTRHLAGCGAASARSSCRRPSSICSSCWCATRASCSTTRRIYDRIWGYDFGPDSKNLAVYICYLRRKLELPGECQVDPHRPRCGVHGSVAS